MNVIQKQCSALYSKDINWVIVSMEYSPVFPEPCQFSILRSWAVDRCSVSTFDAWESRRKCLFFFRFDFSDIIHPLLLAKSGNVFVLAVIQKISFFFPPFECDSSARKNSINIVPFAGFVVSTDEQYARLVWNSPTGSLLFIHNVSAVL